jgi:type IV pilus assembly protein PilO
MTLASEDGFLPEGAEKEGSPPPPGSLVLGPLVITPQIQGIAIAVVGVGLAGVLGWKLILPAMTQTQELEAKITELNNNIEGQKKRKAKLQEVTNQLESAKQEKENVMALFGKNDFLETLLFDVNKIVVENHKGTIQKFNPVKSSSSGWILGETPAGAAGQTAAAQPAAGATPAAGAAAAPPGPKLSEAIKGVTIQVQMQGKWEQQQAALQDLERLPAMVLMDQFVLEVDRSNQKLLSSRVNQYTPEGEPKLNTSFNLLAVVPLPAEELEKLAAPPPPKEEEKKEGEAPAPATPEAKPE